MIPLAGRRWHVRLGPEQLPQQLTVVFRGAPSSSGRQHREIPVPHVTDLDTVRTLWTVRGPSGLTIAADQIREHRTTSIRQEKLRLSNTSSLVESASEIIFDSPVDEVNGWYSPWATRMAVSDARLTKLRWFPEAGEQFDAAAVDAIRMQQEGVATRLKTTNTLMTIRQETNDHPQDQDVWAIGQHPGSDVAHFSFIGAVGRIPVAFPSDRGPGHWWFWLAAVAVLAVGWTIYVLLRRGYLSSKVVEWPYALGVLAGLAWWLWCTPSLFGWLLVIVCVVGALRPPAHCNPLPSPNGPHPLSHSRRSRRSPEP